MKTLPNEKLRVAVVGLGKMGLLHSCLLKTLPNVELVALCDKSFIIRRIYRKLCSAVQLTDDAQKLAGLNLDAVYITTPIPSHFSIVRTRYVSKIARNLFVEKTLASTYDEARQLCELAKNVEGVNMVGYMKRFAVTFKKAKELLNQNVLGDLISFDAYAYSSDFSEIKGSKMSSARGGVLGDLGSHVVDLALWFFGDFQVESAKLEFLNALGSEDSAQFRVTTAKGLEGCFDISWCKKGYRMPEFGLTIKGTNGTMKVTDDEVKLEPGQGKSLRWFRHDLNDSVNFLLGGPEYFREDEYFINSVLSNTAAEPDFLDALKVDYVLDQVKRRADEK